MTCRVLSVDPEKDKMALTFILDGEVRLPSKRKLEKEEEVASKRLKDDKMFVVGEVLAEPC